MTDLIQTNLFEIGLIQRTIQLKDYYVTQIGYEDTKPFILDIHYAKRMPSISYAYGLFKRSHELIGCVTYGFPPSPSLCKGIAGERFRDDVLELNRLVLKHNKKNQASMLIASSFKLLPQPRIIVSYADTDQDHIGVVYQATNFLYTGLSDKRPKEWKIRGSNLHSKNVCKNYTLDERKSDPNKFIEVERPRKHRYIYFIGTKTEKKVFRKNLNYGIEAYPKLPLANSVV